MAVELLEAIRGAQRLGMTGLNFRELTAYEFALVSYFATQLDGMQNRGK